MDDNEVFRSRMRHAVKISGKTQSAIAEKAGLGQGSMSNIAKGHEPNAHTLRKLCRTLGVSADWLLNLKQDPRPYARQKLEQAVFRQALEKFGWEHQLRMLFEEMSELQNALCKEARGRDTPVHIAEEVADVEIMLEQVKLHFGVGGEARRVRGEKVDRLREKVEGERHGSGT